MVLIDGKKLAGLMFSRSALYALLSHGPRVKPPSIRWTLGSESRVEARGRSEVSLTQQGKSALRIFGEGNKD